MSGRSWSKEGGGDPGGEIPGKVSEVRAADSDILACLISDVHLSDTCPLARAEKENWQDVQFGYIAQVRQFCNRHKCPLVIAGDVFDKWKSGPEVVNRAIREFGRFAYGVYAVAGNHDLPYHNYRDVGKSSYGTLVACGAVQDLQPGLPRVLTTRLCLHGFPWGHKIRPRTGDKSEMAHVAVCHAYVWMTARSGYSGASDDDHILAYKDAIKTYDAVLFGDNHKQFSSCSAKGQVLNLGAFVRRRSDEFHHTPAYGILWATGRVTTEPLDVDQDKWVPKIDELADVRVNPEQLEQFLEMLKDDRNDRLDFKEQLLRYMTALKVSTAVQGVILKALEG